MRLDEGLTSGVAHMEQAVKDYLPTLLSSILEVAEKGIFLSEDRRKNYDVIRSDIRVVETTIGTLRFTRRYYRHKKTGEYVYLLDRMLQLAPRERIDKGLAAALLSLIHIFKLLEAQPLDSIITPRRLIADIIIRFVRAMQNSEGSNVDALYRIADKMCIRDRI